MRRLCRTREAALLRQEGLTDGQKHVDNQYEHPHSQTLKVYQQVADSNGEQSLLTRVGKGGTETVPMTR